MVMSGFKRRSFIISVLLLMICVQSFSIHSHLSHETSEHHSHMLVHSHVTDHDASHNADIEHADEASNEIQGALLKQLLSLDFLVYFLLFVVLLDLARCHHWQAGSQRTERRFLLFIRPPLRAPPV